MDNKSDILCNVNLLSAVIMLSCVDGASDFHDKSEVIVLVSCIEQPGICWVSSHCWKLLFKFLQK